MIELILLLTRRHVLDTFLFLFIYFLKETTISFNLEKRISFFYIFATFGYGLHPEYLAKTRLTTNNIWSFEFDRQPKELSGKALANEDTLLRTHCCGHIVATQIFPRLPARATFVADTNFVSRIQKRFLILFRNILCPQQMFPSLRSPRNIMGNNVSATMCPRLPGPVNLSTSLTKTRHW